MFCEKKNSTDVILVSYIYLIEIEKKMLQQIENKMRLEGQKIYPQNILTIRKLFPKAWSVIFLDI